MYGFHQNIKWYWNFFGKLNNWINPNSIASSSTEAVVVNGVLGLGFIVLSTGLGFCLGRCEGFGGGGLYMGISSGTSSLFKLDFPSSFSRWCFSFSSPSVSRRSQKILRKKSWITIEAELHHLWSANSLAEIFNGYRYSAINKNKN